MATRRRMGFAATNSGELAGRQTYVAVTKHPIGLPADAASPELFGVN